MYTDYFGFTEPPFSIAPDPRYLFMSEAHREAMAHLRYGLRSDGGFVLITGEIGAGKTTLCRSLLQNLPDNLDLAYVLNPRVTVIELLETIADELRLDRATEASVKHFVDQLNLRLLDNHARGRKTVLIIDEAQNLSAEVLEQLRLLTNLETDRRKLLQIVLIGQPELRQMLTRPEMRQLAQRITARYHLPALDRDEIAGYVQHRLQVAGGSPTLFPPRVLRRLWPLTRGVPRLINLICDRALLGAYAQERQVVDRPILRQAAREVLDDLPGPGLRTPFWGVGLVIVLLTCTAGLAIWLSGPGTVSGWLGTESTTTPPAQSLATTPPTVKPATPPPEPLPPPSEPEPPPIQPAPATIEQALVLERDRAFADLAGLWGLRVPAGEVADCRLAEAENLRCLARQDSLEALRRLDRPALLTLYADDGTPGYAVLVGFSEDRVTLLSAGESHQLPVELLKPRWFGEFLVLWRPPVAMDRLLIPGMGGDTISWLAHTLEDLGHYRVTGEESRLAGALLGSLKRFQYAAGLTPDGVVGPLTLIHLNNAADSSGPRLGPGKAD